MVDGSHKQPTHARLFPLGVTTAGLIALGAIATGVCARQAATISLDPGTVFQTMRGWEATTPAYRFTTDAFMDQVVAAGINRVRLEVPAGAENTIDYYGAWQATLGGVETPDPIRGSSPEADAFIANWYRTVNDNGDPGALNASGFHFTTLDQSIARTVGPLRAKLAARGERLYVNLCYVAFNPTGAIPVHDDPDEYAEFMLAAFRHLETRYGWVPDGIEVMLEPDSRPQWWDGVKMGRRIIATQAKLAAAGYRPDFIGPSTADTHNAWFYIDDMLARTPAAIPYIKEFSYHRYAEADTVYVRGVGTRAAAAGIGGAMLEWWNSNNTYATLHEDLTDGRASAWQRGVVQPLNNADYYPYLRHYFSHVRLGARRIGASTTDGSFAPVAFINPNGTWAVVVKAASGGAIVVPGLPAGTYGIRYTTATATDVDAGSQTVSSGGAVSASIPEAGVLVVFGGAAASPAPIPTPIPPPGSFGKGSPGSGATGQPTNLTLSWSASSGAASYEYCLDTTDNDACSTTWVPTGTATGIAVAGLSPNTSYFWQVRATNASGSSTYANGTAGVFWKFTTQAGLPAPGPRPAPGVRPRRGEWRWPPASAVPRPSRSDAPQSTGASPSTPVQPVDLRSVGDAHLTFRSWLSSGRSPAMVQISADGLAWHTLLEVPSIDMWTAIDLDLTRFVGQVAYIRFILGSSGAAPDTTGNLSPDVWWIKDVQLDAGMATSVAMARKRPTGG